VTNLGKQIVMDFYMMFHERQEKTFKLFTGLCSALLDSIIVAFCKYFNNDRIKGV